MPDESPPLSGLFIVYYAYERKRYMDNIFKVVLTVWGLYAVAVTVAIWQGWV